MNETDVIELGDITDFGGNNSSSSMHGIELLMNNKGKAPKQSIGTDDLDALEKDLNSLSDNDAGGVKILNDDPIRLNVGFEKLNTEPDTFIKINETTVGEAIRDTTTNEKTWDGFGQFSEIPVEPSANISTKPALPKEEVMRQKFLYLRKLEGLEKKGVELTKKYSMDSNLQEMIGEYEMVVSEKERENSVKFQGNMLSAFINGVEFLNNRFDPFDIKLDGWGEQFSENVTDYDDIFAELHEKYSSKAKMAPEIKLIFQLAASGMMVHMTNTMFKSAMPNMDDVLRQNPDLMQQFNSAAMNSVSQTNPGFGGLMNNIMNPEQPQHTPPVPVRTQDVRTRHPPSRPGQLSGNPFDERTMRPDLNTARGNVQNQTSDDINDNVTEVISSQRKRSEMKGPSDISDILGGLKPKSTSSQSSNVFEPLQPKKVVAETRSINDVNIPTFDDDLAQTGKDEGSTISLSELKELESEGSIPKKTTKRKPRSNKNTISIDI